MTPSRDIFCSWRKTGHVVGHTSRVQWPCVNHRSRVQLDVWPATTYSHRYTFILPISSSYYVCLATNVFMTWWLLCLVVVLYFGVESSGQLAKYVWRRRVPVRVEYMYGLGHYIDRSARTVRVSFAPSCCWFASRFALFGLQRHMRLIYMGDIARAVSHVDAVKYGFDFAKWSVWK